MGLHELSVFKLSHSLLSLPHPPSLSFLLSYAFSVIITASNNETGLGAPINISQNTSSDFEILKTFTLGVVYISAISVNVSWLAQKGVYEYRIHGICVYIYNTVVYEE